MGHASSKENSNLANALTLYDLELIRICWDSVKEKDDLGLRVMVRIFQTDKEMKKIWIFASNLESEDEMLENSQVQYHAKKVIATINRIVLSLTSSISETDQTDLVRLGKSHYHYGIKKEHFKTFEDCFVYCLEKNINAQNIYFHEKSEQAWRRFIQFIFQQYEDGMTLVEKESKLKKEKKINFN